MPATERSTGAKGRARAPCRSSREAVRAGHAVTFSERFACPEHGPSLVELEPRIFSFNSPHGACERCTGLGSQMEIDPELVVPDPELSIGEGALAPWAGSSSNYYEQMTEAIAERYEVDLEAPWEELPEEQRDVFLYGTGGEPVQVTYRNRYGRRRSYATRSRGSSGTSNAATARPTRSSSREKIEEFMSLRPCPVCGGARLRAGVARGARRRDAASRTSARCRRGGRSSGSTRWSCRRPTGTSRG